MLYACAANLLYLFYVYLFTCRTMRAPAAGQDRKDPRLARWPRRLGPPLLPSSIHPSVKQEPSPEPEGSRLLAPMRHDTVVFPAFPSVASRAVYEFVVGVLGGIVYFKNSGMNCAPNLVSASSHGEWLL